MKFLISLWIFFNFNKVEIQTLNEISKKIFGSFEFFYFFLLWFQRIILLCNFSPSFHFLVECLASFTLEAWIVNESSCYSRRAGFSSQWPPDVFLSSQAQGGWKNKTKADRRCSVLFPCTMERKISSQAIFRWKYDNYLMYLTIKSGLSIIIFYAFTSRLGIW